MAPPDIDNVAMTTHTHTHRAAADDYSGQFESICSAAATGFSQECHMIKSCGLLFSPVVARLPFSCLDFPGAAGYLLLLSPAMILHGLSTNTPFCSLFIYIYLFIYICIYLYVIYPAGDTSACTKKNKTTSRPLVVPLGDHAHTTLSTHLAAHLHAAWTRLANRLIAFSLCKLASASRPSFAMIRPLFSSLKFPCRIVSFSRFFFLGK